MFHGTILLVLAWLLTVGECMGKNVLLLALGRTLHCFKTIIIKVCKDKVYNFVKYKNYVELLYNKHHLYSITKINSLNNITSETKFTLTTTYIPL